MFPWYIGTAFIRSDAVEAGAGTILLDAGVHGGGYLSASKGVVGWGGARRGACGRMSSLVVLDANLPGIDFR